MSPEATGRALADEHELQLARLGDRLRAERKKAGLSIDSAARESGLSKGFISLLENGKTDTSVGRLSRLLMTYQIEMKDILSSLPHEPESTSEPNPEPGPPRPSDLHYYTSADEGIVYQMFDVFEGRLPVYVTIAPGGEWSEPSIHNGAETLFIIAGNLDISVNGAVSALRPGQTVRVASRAAHRLANRGSGDAILFALVDQPGPSVST